MAVTGNERRLASIVALDVAGYSARTEADEAGTVAAVVALRPTIERIAHEHAGRVFNTAGDGFMLEFGSSSGAVEAALSLAKTCEPKVRVGVHLGDVAVQPNGDLLGHGVNVAARLMARAAPGSALVSSAVWQTLRGPLASRLTSRGILHLDKMHEAIEAFALGAPGDMAMPGVVKDPLLAVLAFDNLSGDPQMAYFSDGVSEEIQETVARGAELKVIGRTSAFQLRGADKTVRKAASELKATHVLDGSVRRAGQRVRISAQLIDCASETTLWANRFDGDLTDIFALQDEIAAAVAAALKIAFAPARPARSVNPAAHDLYLQAREIRNSTNRDATPVAIEMFRKVVELDPGFARGWADLAVALAFGRRYLRLPDITRQDAAQAADKALALDPSLGVAWGARNFLEPVGRYKEREILLSRALAASPMDPESLMYMGYLCSETGRLADCLGYAGRALQLDPKFAPSANWYASTFDAMGRFDESRALWDDYLARWPQADPIAVNALSAAATSRDWDRFESLTRSIDERILAKPSIADLVRYFRNRRDPDPQFVSQFLARAQRIAARTGSIPINVLVGLYHFGLREEVFELVDKSSFTFMFDPDGPPPSDMMLGIIFHAANRGMIDDPRLMMLCAKLGLCAYWIATDNWPDCVDLVPYDFRAEARRAAALSPA